MVDAVVTVFLEEQLRVLAQESNVLIGFKDQCQKVEGDLKYIRSFFKDAERIKHDKMRLKITLADLRELVYEAEDILADCQLMSTISGRFLNGPKKIPAKYQMGKRLGKINENESLLLKKRSQRTLGPFLYQSMEICRKMPHPDGILPSMITHRYEGQGKTTVAQTVYNVKEIELFETIIWVSVSQKFTEEKVMRSILRNLGDGNIGDDRGDLLKRIHQYLLGKRFLLVLYDV